METENNLAFCFDLNNKWKHSPRRKYSSQNSIQEARAAMVYAVLWFITYAVVQWSRKEENERNIKDKGEHEMKVIKIGTGRGEFNRGSIKKFKGWSHISHSYASSEGCDTAVEKNSRKWNVHKQLMYSDQCIRVCKNVTVDAGRVSTLYRISTDSRMKAMCIPMQWQK